MSTTLYKPILNAVSDKLVTQPLSQVSIPTPFQTSVPDWGLRWNVPTPYGGLHLATFQPPMYQPNPEYVPFSMINNQATANGKEKCPVVPILYRNHWETYNINSGKVFGGFTPFSLLDIPSCQERSENVMNFVDFTKPWSRVMSSQRGDVLAYDDHYGEWAKTMPIEVERRLKGYEF